MKLIRTLVFTMLSISSLSAEIVLYGGVQNGDSYLLSLKDTESATSLWIPVGGEISGYTVVGYDAETGRAKLKKGDIVIESALPKSNVKGVAKPMPGSSLQAQRPSQIKPSDTTGRIASDSTSVGDYPKFQPQNVDVVSSSEGESTDACVAILTAATDSICIQALKHLPAEFDRALVAAGKRGVKVEAFLDDSEPLENHGGTRPVAHGNVPIVIVVDEATVITGLLNVSRSTQDQQLEGLLVIRDNNLAKGYLEELTRKKAASKSQSAL